MWSNEDPTQPKEKKKKVTAVKFPKLLKKDKLNQEIHEAQQHLGRINRKKTTLKYIIQTAENQK